MKHERRFLKQVNKLPSITVVNIETRRRIVAAIAWYQQSDLEAAENFRIKEQYYVVKRVNSAAQCPPPHQQRRLRQDLKLFSSSFLALVLVCAT